MKPQQKKQITKRIFTTEEIIYSVIVLICCLWILLYAFKYEIKGLLIIFIILFTMFTWIMESLAKRLRRLK